MTTDQQSTGRQAEGERVSRRLRAFRPTRASRLRVAAVGSALCLAAGMGIGMASQASAARIQPPPGGGDNSEGGALPVCITNFGGVLRLAIPPSTCNGHIVRLELAGSHPHSGPEPGPGPSPDSGISTYVNTAAVYAATPDPTNSSLEDLIATAECNNDDVATGGGFSSVIGVAPAAAAAALPSNAITILDAPTHHGHVAASGDEPDGWTAGLAFPVGTAHGGLRGITVYVVCAPAGHSNGGGPGDSSAGSGSMAPAHAAARHH